MTRVLVIGAGPAGVRAVQTLVAAGLHPVVVDEGARAGGQIYRRPPDGFARSAEKLYGSDAAKARALHGLFDDLVDKGCVTYLPGRSVLALANGVAHVVGPQGRCEIAYDRLIIATGATDRLAPLPGWQSPGVYSLGAAQIALKAQGVTLGQKIVLAGSGPLLTLLATQLRASDAGLVAVLDTAPMRGQIANGVAMARARPWVTLRGLKMRAALGRLYHAGVTLERIEASPDDGPRSIVWRDAAGHSQSTACDTVAMGWHLRADTTLADIAGAKFDWSGTFAQWLPRRDTMTRAGQGLYLAGDGARPLGADGAELSGQLAAMACLADLGLMHADPAPVQRALVRMERFATALARAFPWPAEMIRALPDDTVLCRCEGVHAGDLRATLPLSGPEANRAKSLARVGMGRCQGRYCQLAAAEIIAAAANRPVAEAGRLRAQPPARPVTVGTWLSEDPTQLQTAL